MCEAILTIFYLITVWRTHCLESGKVVAHPMHSNTGLGGRLQALLLRLWREHRLLGAVHTDEAESCLLGFSDAPIPF
jgi:hypothetical protein